MIATHTAVSFEGEQFVHRTYQKVTFDEEGGFICRSVLSNASPWANGVQRVDSLLPRLPLTSSSLTPLLMTAIRLLGTSVEPDWPFDEDD